MIEYLKYHLNDSLWKAAITDVKEDAVIAVDYLSASLVNVEFINEQCCQHFLDVSTVSFCGVDISFNHECEQIARTDNPITQAVTKVTISDLPPCFNKDLIDYLKYSLNEILCDAGVAKYERNTIVDLEYLSSSSVNVEFMNEECCKFLLNARTVNFCGVEISIKQDLKIVNKINRENSTISDIVNVEVLGKCLEGNEAESLPSQKKKSYLKTEEEKTFFLKKLILTRRLFQNKRNFPAGFARLLAETQQAGIEADLQDMNIRRKYWLDYHNKVKSGTLKDNFYRKPLQVIFDDAPIDILHGTAFEGNDNCDEDDVIDEVKVAATAALFCKCAVFSIAACKYLIRVMRENYEEYMNARNGDHFWREISIFQQEKKHYHEGSSCERKFNEAKRLYRAEAERLKRTGESGPSQEKALWFWSDDMHFIMSKDVTVAPPLTVACGASSQLAIKHPRTGTALDEEWVDEDGPDDPPRLVGKQRVPQLKRPKSKADKRADILMALVTAMNKRTAVLERSVPLQSHQPQ